MVSVLDVAERNIVQDLVREVLNGEHQKDRLINSSYDFSKEAQALYFSNTRKYLRSDVTAHVVEDNQRVDDINIIKMIEGRKSNE